MKYFNIVLTGIFFLSLTICAFSDDRIYNLKCEESHIGINGVVKKTMDTATIKTQLITEDNCKEFMMCNPDLMGLPYANQAMSWNGYKIVAQITGSPRLTITLKNGITIFNGNNSELYSQLGADVNDADGQGITTMVCFIKVK